MARATKKPGRSGKTEEISVNALRDIYILFPGDVFDLAVWMARRDLAVSSPTLRVGTTLHGLANDFARLANCAERPLDAEMVMSCFREHGLRGNPVIRLEPRSAEVLRSPQHPDSFGE